MKLAKQITIASALWFSACLPAYALIEVESTGIPTPSSAQSQPSPRGSTGDSTSHAQPDPLLQRAKSAVNAPRGLPGGRGSGGVHPAPASHPGPRGGGRPPRIHTGAMQGY